MRQMKIDFVCSNIQQTTWMFEHTLVRTKYFVTFDFKLPLTILKSRPQIKLTFSFFVGDDNVSVSCKARLQVRPCEAPSKKNTSKHVE